ncbi:RNA polymerase sigma factor SigW [Bacillus sp. ZZV12-4809]|nr:RNA polymerase sigma factor SigW [Bacillus sp. ZZV12-4809]
MDEYGTVLKRLIYSYVKDWNTASDLTQDTYITVCLKSWKIA